MEITELIKETEKYILGSESEHYKSLAEMILRELNNIKKNGNYIVPASVMHSLIDSFDIYSGYWKKYFFKYWDSNPSKFENPYE